MPVWVWYTHVPYTTYPHCNLFKYTTPSPWTTALVIAYHYVQEYWYQYLMHPGSGVDTATSDPIALRLDLSAHHVLITAIWSLMIVNNHKHTQLKTQPSNPNYQTTEPDKLSGIHGSFGNSIPVFFAPNIRLLSCNKMNQALKLGLKL